MFKRQRFSILSSLFLVLAIGGMLLVSSCDDDDDDSPAAAPAGDGASVTVTIVDRVNYVGYFLSDTAEGNRDCQRERFTLAELSNGLYTTSTDATFAGFSSPLTGYVGNVQDATGESQIALGYANDNGFNAGAYYLEQTGGDGTAFNGFWTGPAFRSGTRFICPYVLYLEGDDPNITIIDGAGITAENAAINLAACQALPDFADDADCVRLDDRLFPDPTL